MASSYNNAVTTGAAQDQNELRKRNVSAYENANGGHVVRVEAEDKKKLRKVSKTWMKMLMRHVIDYRQQPETSFFEEYEFIIAPVIFTIIALATRLWKIGLSPIVTWDEAQ